MDFGNGKNVFWENARFDIKYYKYFFFGVRNLFF